MVCPIHGVLDLTSILTNYKKRYFKKLLVENVKNTKKYFVFKESNIGLACVASYSRCQLGNDI